MTTLRAPFDLSSLTRSTEPMYPIIITEPDGTIIDRTATIESALSVLYGDLYYHSGNARTVSIPSGDAWDWSASWMESEAAANADCWSIPVDRIERYES